ncbi:MAG TPA: hypothetical protein VLV31_08275 [Candidatus Acidoferrales bacterium]|nr:hypothetical protein [Candidatus Acidoferrales bacterium]
MVLDPLLESVNVLSVLATASLIILTAKSCRASSVPYLLAIPAGFGLMTVAFAVQAIEPFLVSFSQLLGAPVEAVWLLMQAYGALFLALAYARRTRLPWLGESTSAALLTAALATVAFLAITVLTPTAEAVGGVGSPSGELFLRAIILAAFVYLTYETLRNWMLTQKASQGIVTIGYIFFIIEQLGFLLAQWNLGSVAVFLAYEGRIMGLFLLNAILIVGIKKADPITVMRRLGLGAPAHDRLQQTVAM